MTPAEKAAAIRSRLNVETVAEAVNHFLGVLVLAGCDAYHASIIGAELAGACLAMVPPDHRDAWSKHLADVCLRVSRAVADRVAEQQADAAIARDGTREMAELIAAIGRRRDDA